MLCNDSQDCAIVVSTCDNYSDIWEPFYKLFNKFWPDNPFPVYVNTETLDCIYEGIDITTLKSNTTEISWTKRLKETLERIDSEFVILFLDDFFLFDYVDTTRVEVCLNYMREDSSISAIYFSWLGGQMSMEPSCYPGLERCSDDGKAKINITMTLWRKSILEFYLSHDESAWELEANAFDRSIGRDENFYSFSKNARSAIPYDFGKYGLIAGKWFKDTENLFIKNEIEFDFSRRGFFEEYEFGLIPYVARQIKLDSYIIPSYNLSRSNPFIKSDNICLEGQFKQTYAVNGAENAILWYPSLIHGFALCDVHCEIIYENGKSETLTSKDLYGNFSIVSDTMYFLKPGTITYILPKQNLKISYFSISGYLKKNLALQELSFAYSAEPCSIPLSRRLMLLRRNVHAENYLVPQYFYPFRIYPELCFSTGSGFDERSIKTNGQDLFVGSFNQTYLTLNDYAHSYRWDIGESSEGFAISDLQVELKSDTQVSQILDISSMKSTGTLVNNYWVFLSAPAYMQFPVHDADIVEINISGAIVAPMPKEILQNALRKDFFRKVFRWVAKKLSTYNKTTTQKR